MTKKARVTPAELRAEAEAELAPLGEQRMKLLAQLDELDKRVRPAVIAAVDAELPLRRIQDLTGIAPNTARNWHKKDKATN